jgi:stage V sporulation protein AC
LPPKKQLSVDQQKYQNLSQKIIPQPNILRNAAWAFIFGGIVCIIGQFILECYARLMKIPVEKAGDPAVATMIFLGALLTGLGWFDKLARYAGAGLAVPVTGFANSIVSAALEFKKEGFIQGIGSKMFILAGSVITYGVVTAFFVGLIYSLFLTWK